MIRKGLLAALVLLLFATAPVEAQFLAADLIYVPAVTHTRGDNGTQWRSDLYITNAETDVAIDVAVVWVVTGLISSASQFVDRSTWLGGREADGFGDINEILRDIPPGGTVVLRDPVGEYWFSEGGQNSGALVIFAYEADTLEDDGTRVVRDAIVNTRVYTPWTSYQPDPENDGEFVARTGTYGQTLPGVPWYNLADPSAVDETRDFSFLILSGGTANEDFRYNLGLLNASDPLTSITVSIQPFQGNGEPILDINGQPLFEVVTMPAVSHVQYNSFLATLFGLISAPDDIRVDIKILSWTSGSNDAVVGLTVYGNYIDNTTQDPTAILPAFGDPYNVECQWPPNASEDGAKAGIQRPGHVTRRPVEIPPR